MLTAIGVLAGLYVAALALVFALQRQYIYLPDDRRADLAAAGAADLLTEVALTAADGVTVASWFRPPAAPDRPMLVFLHGNAGSIADRLSKITAFVDAGWGVLLAGYRGYGGNPGKPTESGLYADARAALDFLGRHGIAPARLVLYGESLGSGIATEMALGTSAGALILEAPFTSIADMAQRRFPYFPSRWLVLDRFDNAGKIGRVGMPVLVLHGEGDPITPAALGRRLFAAAREPKELHVFPEAGHVDLFEHGADRVVIEFVERVMQD
jgi:fermentation-respiration switch protein FrsA (DUF1100 family)